MKGPQMTHKDWEEIGTKAQNAIHQRSEAILKNSDWIHSDWVRVYFDHDSSIADVFELPSCRRVRKLEPLVGGGRRVMLLASKRWQVAPVRGLLQNSRSKEPASVHSPHYFRWRLTDDQGIVSPLHSIPDAWCTPLSDRPTVSILTHKQSTINQQSTDADLRFETHNLLLCDDHLTIHWGETSIFLAYSFVRTPTKLSHTCFAKKNILTLLKGILSYNINGILNLHDFKRPQFIMLQNSPQSNHFEIYHTKPTECPINPIVD